MTRQTYESDGPHDASTEEFADALDRADRATEQADRERAQRRSRPGFFVVPDDRLPDL